MNSQKLTYHNITVSGLPGCGSTTLLDHLKEELIPQGWQGFSGGEFMRDYAVKNGLFDPNVEKSHHLATAYSDDFDRQVDLGMRQRLSEGKHWILEAWLSGFFAQQLSGVLKVLLTCSDDSVRIDRIMNRDEVSVDEAKDHIAKRTQKNLDKWQRMYSKEWNEWVVQPGTLPTSAKIDFWLPDLYDLVIDTYSSSREETLAKVLQALRAK